MTEKKIIPKTKNRKLPNSYVATFMILSAMMTSASIYASERIFKTFTNSSFFVLKGMSICGNNKVSTSDIINATGLDIGNDRIGSFIPYIIENRIKSYSRYVEQIKIKRNLACGQLEINVKEREPVAIVAESKDARVLKIVDVNGFIIDELTSKDFALSSYKNIPFIFESSFVGKKRQGEPCIERNPSNLSDPSELYVVSESACLALNVFSEIHSVVPNIISNISNIDARDPDDVIIRMKNGSNIRIASDRIKEGLVDVKHWMTNPGKQNSATNFNYIDARFPGAVYCG
jgi:cell division septal protein FtsQ